MMALIFFLLSIPASLGVITEQYACNFVAARFARCRSLCVSGVCSNVRRTADGRYFRGNHSRGDGNSVSCEDAVADVEAIIDSGGEVRRPSKRQRIHDIGEISERITTHIMPWLELLMDTGNMSINESARIFGEFDSWALTAVAADWPTWIERTQPSHDSVWKDLDDTFTNVMVMAYRCPLAHESAFGVMANFYFDLAALLGRHLVDTVWLVSMGQLALRYAPLHRPLCSRDAPRPGADTIGVPRNIRAMLDSYSTLSAKRLSSRDVGVQVRVLMGLPLADPGGVTEQLFLTAMITKCARLVAWLKVIFDAGASGDMRLKLGASWIDFCRGRTARDALEAARRFIISENGGNAVEAPVNGSALEWFGNASFRVAGFFVNETDPALLVNRLVAEVLEKGLVTRSRGGTGRISEISITCGRMIGVIIGLAFLHGGELDRLCLSPRLLEALNPRFARTVLTPEDYQNAIYKMIDGPWFLPIFERLLEGVVYALGPGGPEMFSNEDWLARIALWTEAAREQSISSPMPSLD